GEHRGREGAERLAVLHLEVEHLLHGGRARIAEDRARAESTRAELHAALEPAERPALGERAGAGFEERLVAERLEHRARLAQPRLDVVVAERRPEVAALHRVEAGRRLALHALVQVMGNERRAERAAGVAR